MSILLSAQAEPGMGGLPQGQVSDTCTGTLQNKIALIPTNKMATYGIDSKDTARDTKQVSKQNSKATPDVTNPPFDVSAICNEGHPNCVQKVLAYFVHVEQEREALNDDPVFLSAMKLTAPMEYCY